MSIKNKLKRITFLRYIYYFPGDIVKHYKDRKLIKENRLKVKNPPEAISRFKDIHKGERCFIVGNGPSLTVRDLDKIAGEYSFGSNRIYNMFPHTKWRPTYYCEADPFVATVIKKEDMRSIINGGSTAFLSLRSCDDYPDGTKENENVYFYYVKPIFGVESIRNETRLPEFSENVPDYFYSGLTITYEMIQLAAYMGFKELYIIGCDHNYNRTIETGTLTVNAEIKNNYPKEMGEMDERIQKPTFNPKTTIAYQAAKKYADEHGIKIYNATRGGRLEVFERVDFDNITTKEC